MQKCEYKFKGKRFSVWSKESFLFFSELFSEFGYMIGGNQIVKFQISNFQILKGGHDFWLKISRGKILEETMKGWGNWVNCGFEQLFFALL